MPPKKIQLEFGTWDYARDLNRNAYSHKLGSTLFRYGLVEDRLEFRFANSGLNLTRNLVGFDSIDLGYKYAFLNKIDIENNKYLPEINLINHFSLPVSDSQFSNSGFNHSYKFLIGKSFSKKWSGLINIGPEFNSARSFRSNGDRIIQLPYVFNLGYQVTKRWQVFTEIFGSWIFSSQAGDILGTTVGTTYALRDNLIIDFNTFWGLNNNTEELEISTGLVYRF
ncbi:MAG: transporter [Candidatus Caenarcaniphilales bacterium]|nr:transporter [Candidatus Caenarcaniphilales bacterium]